MQAHSLHFESLDSTNSYAKSHLGDFPKQGFTCITAKVQTKGRGQFSRKWVSKEGNLHLSLVFFLPLTGQDLIHLAKLATYSSAKALEREGIQVQIKEPNDLLVSGKKLCGILVETTPFEELRAVIVGIGMNVNTPIEEDYPTTSLMELTGKSWDLDILQKGILKQFERDLQKGFQAIESEFNTLQNKEP